tara:strand:- start:86 stop:628 length:543 start_codon:yes stop_codon:yes gene_type:complete
MEKIINKGTGAGGSKTNTNGLPYEELTDLKDSYYVIEKIKYNCEKIKFHNYDNILVRCKKSSLFKIMNSEMDSSVKKAHGCKEPDECYINNLTKEIFIIEKKFQQCSGSVCEKIQTPHFKIWQYKRTFPNWKIVYIYCLADWFRDNCSAEIEYLTEFKVPLFWGSSGSYKKDIIDFICKH